MREKRKETPCLMREIEERGFETKEIRRETNKLIEENTVEDR